MNDKLGILVSSDKYIDHLIGITKAAHRAGKKVTIFLTNQGVFLTKNERFTELEGICHISLCSLCFESFKHEKPSFPDKKREVHRTGWDLPYKPLQLVL